MFGKSIDIVYKGDDAAPKWFVIFRIKSCKHVIIGFDLWKQRALFILSKIVM